MLALIFLCWGSFLNVFAYRIIRNESLLFPRSHCTHCKNTLSWYELIPVISWLLLRGRCRNCNQSISFLYPFIELLTAFVLTALYIALPATYFFGYFIFFSALIVSIRTDLETMNISSLVTLWLIPCGIALSYYNLLPLSVYESVGGAFFGYALLYSIATIFSWVTNKKGIGEGDFELLACIGSFTGLYGCWISLLIGSFIGSFITIMYLLIKRPLNARALKIPFGPFLAAGALFFVFFREVILTYFS